MRFCDNAVAVIQRLQIIIATGFGSGYSPVAPGTCGTVVGVVLFLPLLALARDTPWLYVPTVAATIAIAIWTAAAADVHFASHDNKKIVIDEIVGYFTALIWLPGYSWKVLLAAFVLFRFFDIVKVPPARQIDQKLRGGYGVVLDDVVAGVYSNIILQIVMRTTTVLNA